MGSGTKSDILKPQGPVQTAGRLVMISGRGTELAMLMLMATVASLGRILMDAMLHCPL